MDQKKSSGKRFFLVMLALVVIYLVGLIVLNSVSVAPPGVTAAKVTLGRVSPTPYQGIFFRAPFLSYAVFVNTKQQCSEYRSSQIKTADVQTVSLECSVIYQVNSDKVPEIVTNLDPEKMDSTILSPRIASALQETVGKNDVFLLVTQQAMVQEATKYILEDLLSQDGYISVKDVLFRNPKFSPEFEKIVEQKMVEGQLLEIAKIQTQKVEEEARQMLARAKAELEVLEKKNKYLSNPLVIKYEVAKALKNWDGSTPATLVISGQSDMLPVIPMAGKTLKK